VQHIHSFIYSDADSGADTGKAREEKLLVIPDGLVRRFCIVRTQGSRRKIVRNEFREVERLRGVFRAVRHSL